MDLYKTGKEIGVETAIFGKKNELLINYVMMLFTKKITLDDKRLKKYLSFYKKKHSDSQ